MVARHWRPDSHRLADRRRIYHRCSAVWKMCVLCKEKPADKAADLLADNNYHPYPARRQQAAGPANMADSNRQKNGKRAGGIVKFD